MTASSSACVTLDFWLLSSIKAFFNVSVIFNRLNVAPRLRFFKVYLYDSSDLPSLSYAGRIVSKETAEA